MRGAVEQLQDEMADLMDIGNDIQESMSRSYDIPEGPLPSPTTLPVSS